MNLLLAWLIHVYSAIGAVIAFAALLLIVHSQFREALALMCVSVLIDGTDGTLARRFRVKELLPWFDGARLDDIVDYLNYVFVPCVFVFSARILPQPAAVGLVALMLIASAYGFCHMEAKTSDHFFLGFPSYWNVVALYLYLLDAPVWFNAAVVVVLSLLVFVPIRYVYPNRNPYLRGLTLGLGAVWGLAVLLIIYRLPEPSPALNWTSLLFPVYYLVLSYWLEFRRRGLHI